MISIYSDTYTQGVTSFNVNPGWGQATSLNQVTVAEGDQVIFMENLNYQGHTFDAVDLSSMTHVHFDYYNNGVSNSYIFDGFAGADETYRLNVRIIAKKAWQAHFAHNMFIRPNTAELEKFEPDFTIINASDIQNEEFQQHGLNSKTFVLFHIGRRIAIIGGTEYGGEMKKGIFSVLHYLLPQQGVLSMHCSANTDKNGDNSAIFLSLIHI